MGKHPRRIPLDAQRARATLHAILFPPRAAAASVTGDTLHQLQREQCEWLRCLFPNPLREIHIRPAWRTSTVMELARGIASDRAFDRLPILADALQDADCNDPDLLYHCRHGKAHLPECWAVRAVLGLPEERAEEAMGDS